jgi:uncharacterized protein (DUF1810 family)
VFFINTKVALIGGKRYSPINLEESIATGDEVIDEVFPQLAVLGRSDMARHYGLAGLEEARAYLAHPVLGPRLRECCAILLRLQGSTAVEVFGGTDAMKLRSCLTLFMLASPDDALFREGLRRFYDGEPDPLTLEEVARQEHA